MPVDPQIGLQAKAPDVMGMLGQFSEIQNRLNTNRLFQQTFQARMRAGQILAGSPDLETGLKNLLQDPQTAPFAGETINSIRQGQQTLADINRIQAVTAGEYQKQSETGLGAFMKSLGPVMADPTDATWKAVTDANLATLSPEARARVMPAINSIQQGLMSGLPDDPTERRKQFNLRLSGFMVAGGLTPESMGAVTGTTGLVNLGGAMQPIVTAPAAAGGGVMPVGSPLQMTAPAANLTGPFGPGGAPQLLRVPGQLPQGAPAQNMLGGQPQPTQAPAAPAPAAQAPAGGAVAQGLPLQAQKYAEQRMEAMGKYEENLDDRVITGGTFRRNIDEIISAAKQAQTGGGAESWMRLGQMLQAIGVSNSVVDKMANGSLSSSQVIDKASLTNTMNQLKQQLTGIGGSRINQQEFVAQLSKNPGIATDPRAMVQIFNLWNDFYKRDVAEQQALDQEKASGGDVSRWPAKWSQSDFMKNFAPGETITGAGVKGLPAEGVKTSRPQEAGAATPPREFREGTGKYKGRFFKPDPKRPGQYQEWQP